MDAVEEPCTMLSRWVAHNQKHTAEFADWVDTASQAGQEPVAQEIRHAVEAMQQATEALRSALACLDGNNDSDQHNHFHSSHKEKTHEPATETASTH